MKNRLYQNWRWVIVVALLIGQALASNSNVMAQWPSRNTIRILTAYERGYMAGYADGFNAGENDYDKHFSRNFRNHTLYSEANRGYESRFGPFADYQEGYRWGFEVAYLDGYSGRAYDSRIPPNVAKTAQWMALSPGRRDGAGTEIRSLIPEGALLRIRLETRLTTETNQEGDRFTAKVIEPSDYQGAIIRGHIAKIERSRRMVGRTEMALDFDAVTLRDGRGGPFNARIEKVFATESVKSVDEEGNVESASKTKETEIRSVGGAVLGAVIGGIVGGGQGAAIGAIIGAGAGAGSVY
ncbi:MAG TPA: hypothetical protein VIC84_06245, partial [Blastocatellia bacterium]